MNNLWRLDSYKAA